MAASIIWLIQLWLFHGLDDSQIIHFKEQKLYDASYPANIYLFKVNNKDNRKMCEICSKLTIKMPERRPWRHSGDFIVNFEHISYFFLVFSLLTLNK